MVRNLPLTSPADLDRADVSDLIDAELHLASTPMATSSGAQVILRSVSRNQRPRR